MVMCSGFNTDLKSSEPLKTLVMICYSIDFLCFSDRKSKPEKLFCTLTLYDCVITVVGVVIL